MTVDYLLKNGLVIVEGEPTRKDVALYLGKIEGIYSPGNDPPAQQVIDCENLYVLPGAIDIHVHLRDLENSDKEDFATGTRAAAAGGVTTVVDMPNSNPPTLNRDSLEEKVNRAKEKRFVNVGFYSGIPRKASDFDEQIVPDILGFKVYPHSPITKGTSYSQKRIHACLKLSEEHNIPLLLHPETGGKRPTAKTLDAFLKQHTCESEGDSIQQFLAAQSEVGGRLHICHVSCASSVRTIEKHRAEDLLTAEVAPHHLFLAGGDFTHTDGAAKMLPPLRSPHDNKALQKALHQCVIDCVASDHAPHTEQEKRAKFLEASSGIPGLETTVPLMLTEVLEGRLTWVEYLRCCCSAPAHILKLDSKGVLAKGYDADICIVKKEESVICGAFFHSKAKVTPFEGRQVRATPVMTFVGGDLVYNYGQFLIGPGVAGRVPVRKT